MGPLEVLMRSWDAAVSGVRLDRFAYWLGLMSQRARHVVRGDCFVIFEVEEQVGGEEVGRRGRGERMRRRYVQFLFREGWFMMDLPNETLGASEAARLLGERRGFFWQREQPDRTLSPEYIPRFDPLNKAYLYGDERWAAEETEWVFGRLWGLGREAEIRVTSAAFDGGMSWERKHPLGRAAVRLRRRGGARVRGATTR